MSVKIFQVRNDNPRNDDVMNISNHTHQCNVYI